MWQKQPWTKFGASCSAQSTWLAWPNQLAAKVRVRFMVMVWLGGGKGSLPPPPQHPKSPHLDTPPPTTPNCPTWTPPPQPTLPEPPPPQPLQYPPPHSPSLNPALQLPPPPPPPPPQGASGQQLVGGVVGVQNRGVAPPVAPPFSICHLETSFKAHADGPRHATRFAACRPRPDTLRSCTVMDSQAWVVIRFCVLAPEVTILQTSRGGSRARSLYVTPPSPPPPP